jgi:hypothetical protein
MRQVGARPAASGRASRRILPTKHATLFHLHPACELPDETELLGQGERRFR